MNICNDGHSEIVYTDWTCPLCSLQIDLHKLRDEYEQLEQELNTLEDDLNICANACATYRSALASIAPEYLL